MWWWVAAALASEVSLEIETVQSTVTRTTESRLTQTLGRVLDFYEHGLGVRFPDSLTVAVTIVGDKKRYREIASAAGAPDWAGGFFKREPGQAPLAVLWGKGDTNAMMRVFLHEGAHFLLGYAGRSPRWLDEGLAQCFEHSRISGNQLSIRPPPYYLEYLKKQPAPQVEGIVTNPSRWNDLPSDEVGPLYVQGWALTALLMSTANGQETLGAIVRSYQMEGTKESGLEAIESTYRGGLKGLQNDLEGFIANPPTSVGVPRFVEIEEKSDALWTTCADGRLVSTAVGCDP